MGVYFPNMKKPPTCSECPVKLDCGLYWDVPDDGIDSNCPVIYVNSPHGRLIDADELMDRARGCLDELTILSLEFLVNGSSTIVPAEGG